MIERHITFNVHPGRGGDFERFFSGEYRPAMAKSPGFIKAELLREAENSSRYQMILRFADADGAAGWRTSDVHQALQPGLNEMHGGMEVQGYEVVD